MTSILALAALLLQSNHGHEWPTLREELMKHGLEGAQVAGIDDIERRITSYAVGSDNQWFAIAYYRHEGESLGQLRVRTLDRRANHWRYAVFDPDVLKGGSALRIARAGRWVYLDLHINPSAGSLIVLDQNLTVKRRLAGWSSLLLDDERVVYENNMVHFAPYHPASATLYDPSSDREEKLYPLGPIDPPIEMPEDRSIVTIKATAPQSIVIVVIEQDLRWRDNARTEPNGPERKLTVSCDVSAPKPRCIAEPAR